MLKEETAFITCWLDSILHMA